MYDEVLAAASFQAFYLSLSSVIACLQPHEIRRSIAYVDSRPFIMRGQSMMMMYDGCMMIYIHMNGLIIKSNY